MNNQQLMGAGLVFLAVGLMAWSMWPMVFQWVKKTDLPTIPKPEPKPQPESDPIYDWAELHMKIAELSVMLNGNPSAKAKLNELGALLYDDSKWGQADEQS